MHHLPEKGSPERDALIREIKLDPAAHCRQVMLDIGTSEIDALLASLMKTKGLNEEDPYA